MLSAILFAAMTVGAFVLSAWAMAWAARRAGSPRGTLGIGAMVQLGCIAISLVQVLLAPLVMPRHSRLHLEIMQVAVLAAQWIGFFLIIRYAFRLTVLRTLAPLSALFVLNAAEFALLVFVVRPHVVEPFLINSNSMSPTIQPGDRIVVNKLEHPRRMDLVAYLVQSPRPAIYCKRVVALPGERLRFDGGNLYLNDQQLALPPAMAGRCHTYLPKAPGMERYQDGQTITLGADELFLLGDNLDESVDSRTIGPLKRNAIVGVVDLFYWPVKRIRVVR